MFKKKKIVFQYVLNFINFELISQKFYLEKKNFVLVKIVVNMYLIYFSYRILNVLQPL